MAHTIYTVDGNRVPSVTTVLSRFKDSGGLVHWAWDLGTQGKDYRQERGRAANIGTICHRLVEAHIRGFELDLDSYEPELLKRAQTAFEGFRRWADSTHLEAANTEVSLVSQEHRYGGTLDAVLIQDQLSIADWKTSTAVYVDYLCQLAAYGQLWDENSERHKVTGGFHLLRFDRDTGDFHHHHYPDLTDALEMFLHLRRCYELDKTLKKRA